MIKTAKFLKSIKEFKVGFIVSGIFLIILIISWIIIAVTGIGVKGAWSYWNEAGVPILSWQIWLSVLVTIGVTFFLHKLLFQKFIFLHKDLIICVMLFVVTAAVWLVVPAETNFFSPGPTPPNYTFYPYSDAAVWDTNGIFALIGQGFANGYIGTDHVGLSGFFAILHAMLGMDTTGIIVIQVILYAIFPVLLFLIGKYLLNRVAGFFIAILGILQEINALLGSRMINLSNVRLLMTEFPTAIGLAALSLILIIWLRSAPEKKIPFAIPTAGIVAMLILLRLNTLVFPIVLIAGSLFIFLKEIRSWIKASALFLVSLVLILSPWMINSWIKIGTPFFFLSRTSLILDDSFRREQNSPTSPLSNQLIENYKVVNAGLLIFQPAKNYYDAELSLSTNYEHQASSLPITIINHFTHNLVTSVQVLPVSVRFYDLKQTIYEISPYWNKINGNWSGQMATREIIFMCINLILISLGIGASWYRWRLAGLVPLAVFLTYNFSLALARTSGGRYLVPISWIVILYFGFGLTQIAIWCFSLFKINYKLPPGQPEHDSFTIKKGLLLALPFLIFTLIIALMDNFIPPRYDLKSNNEVLEFVMEKNLLDSSEIEKVNKLVESTHGFAGMGLELYPNYYLSGEGIPPHELMGNEILSYSRLVFKLIGPAGKLDVVLPSDHPPEVFPTGKDAIVIGCQQPPDSYGLTYVDAYIVILLDENPIVYRRYPEGEWQCPQPLS